MHADFTVSGYDRFWESLSSLGPFANEADVEHRLVAPLLATLGYEIDDIQPKVPVSLTKGTKKGRSFEADMVVYAGLPKNRDTSLLVIEAKSPKKTLEDAKDQAESYAVALRTPVLLLTNGVDLQVWQLQRTHESALIFESNVMRLAEQRPRLEHLLSKQSLIRQIEMLEIKKISAELNFKDYKLAELSRNKLRAIARRLVTELGDVVLSTSLMESYSKGALIIAPSGYGKTVLCKQLMEQAIEKSICNFEHVGAIDFPLFEFAQSNCDVMDFICQRIKAKQAQISLATVRFSVQRFGVTLVCDGYEYVPYSLRSSVDSQLRLFKRDYPDSQIFIFSRSSMPVRLELPCLLLEKLDSQEQKNLVVETMGKEFPAFGIPKFLTALSEVPLLLSRIINFFMVNSAFPSRLEELFEHWLTQLSEGFTSTPTTKIYLNEAMLLIADSSVKRRLTAIEALKLITDAGLGSECFDNLHNAGIIVSTGTGVGFLHDALGDYLHARALAKKPQAEFLESIDTLDIQPDSLLPVMLISLVYESACRKRLWGKIDAFPLRQYINVARSCKAAGEPNQDNVQEFLNEVLSGVDIMQVRYFPDISHELRSSLAYVHVPVDDVAIHGDIDSTSSSKLSYKITPSDGLSLRVKQTSPSDNRMVHDVDLKRSRLNMNGGRYAAALNIKGALNEIVRQRNFRGGVLLANERSLSRIRYLASLGFRKFTPDDSLAYLLDQLRPFANEVVPARQHSDIAFPINSLIDDLRCLQDAGREIIEWWWLPHWDNEDQMFEKPELVKAYLNFHFSRATDLYIEVVNASFGSVASEFSYLNAMPFRREALVSGGSGERAINWYWVPVQKVDDSRTICWFEHELPDGVFMNSTKSKHISTELLRLNRSVGGIYTSGRGGAFPAPNKFYQGRQYNFEAPTLSEVAEMVKSDISGLFWNLLH